MSSVISFPQQGRSAEAIRAEIQGHIDAIRALAVELGTVSGCDPAVFGTSAKDTDEILSLQRVAHAIGWTEPRLKRHIVKHNRMHPRDPIGHQPGGMANTAWCIPMARLRRYVRDQRE